MNTYLVILSALVATLVTGFPNGAPTSACGSMKPIHMLFGAQETLAPFSLSVSAAQANAASPVTVILETTDTSDFRGYIIQARTADNNTGLGTFSTEGSQGKTMNCPGGIANAVTHANRSRRQSESFVWTPPAGFKGDVTFLATVVVGFRTYFTDLESSPVSVV